MEVILIRYAELGLKSERVRARFLSRLTEDINRRLLDNRTEHIIRSERGRIFLETDEREGIAEILGIIPGIHSFSISEEVSSDIPGLMKGLSLYSSSRLKEGMTFGIKVKKSTELEVSSRDIAIMAGDAVCSHLDDSKVKVDLKDPDIWFEIEIRRDRAYLFTERIEGLGGMPSATQGKVLLFLPPAESLSGEINDIRNRTLLSRMMMIRRGCRVIPAIMEKDLKDWEDLLSELKERGKDPFILAEGDPEGSLADAVSKTDSSGIVHPGTLEDIGSIPPIHGLDLAVSVFQPTAGLNDDEVRTWLERFNGPVSS